MHHLHRYTFKKYMSHDLLTRITEGKRSHINGVLSMQRYCDATRLSWLSEESRQWTRNRAHNMALLYFGFPDSMKTQEENVRPW